MKTNKKGISLIVLVITIIVMIILATAIILSITSNDIVDNTKKATKANNLANAKQLVVVAEGEWQMEPEEGMDFKQYAEQKLIASGYTLNGGEGSIEVTETANVYIYPKIPDGFVASQIPGETKVSEGLVIYQTETPVKDVSARELYNQYVWIPVDDINTFERKEWKQGTLISETTSYDVDNALEAIEYNEMKASVEKYGGFYIARCETGNDNGKPITKMNVPVWNNISWTDAKAKAKQLSTDSVVSHLIYGEEWDAALSYIAETDESYLTSTAGVGNYTGVLRYTGTNFDKNNIHDMAGNVWEWTQEYMKEELPLPEEFGKQYTIYHIIRGGYHLSIDSSFPLGPSSYRHHVVDVADAIFGFRMALYLK